MTSLTCKYHANATLLEDSHAGDLVCSQCGLVVCSRVIDVGSEWRTFTGDSDSKDMSRVGAAENELLGGADLSTIIAHSPDTRKFGENGQQLLKQRRQTSAADRTLISAFSEISQMAERLRIPKNHTEEAHKLFKLIHTKGTMRGRGNDAITAACIYYVCRQKEIPRTFKEVCAVSHVSKKDIGKAFKKIVGKLNFNVSGIKVSDYMTRFCSNLQLNHQIQKVATVIAVRAKDHNVVSSRSPVSLAAAAIYMAALASGIRKEKKDISEVTGVAEATIIATYKQLRPSARHLFPDGFQFVISPEDLPN